MINFTTELEEIKDGLKAAGFATIESKGTWVFREFAAIKDDIRIHVTYDPNGRSSFTYGKVQGLNDRGRMTRVESDKRSDWTFVVREVLNGQGVNA